MSSAMRIWKQTTMSKLEKKYIKEKNHRAYQAQTKWWCHLTTEY